MRYLQPNNDFTEINVLDASYIDSSLSTSYHPDAPQILSSGIDFSIPKNPFLHSANNYTTRNEGLYVLAGQGLRAVLQKIMASKRHFMPSPLPNWHNTPPLNQVHEAQSLERYKHDLISINGRKAFFISHGNGSGKVQQGGFLSGTKRNGGNDKGGGRNRKYGINPYSSKDDDGDDEDPKNWGIARGGDSDQAILLGIENINFKLNTLRSRLAGQDNLINLVPENISTSEDATINDVMLDTQIVMEGLTELNRQLTLRIESNQQLSNRFTLYLKSIKSVTDGILRDISGIQEFFNHQQGDFSAYSISELDTNGMLRILGNPDTGVLTRSTTSEDGMASAPSDSTQINSSLNRLISLLPLANGLSVAINPDSTTIIDRMSKMGSLHHISTDQKNLDPQANPNPLF